MPTPRVELDTLARHLVVDPVPASIADEVHGPALELVPLHDLSLVQDDECVHQCIAQTEDIHTHLEPLPGDPATQSGRKVA